MRIVQQSAPVSHCPFPALPAPRIAGLISATIKPAPKSTVIIARSYQSQRARQFALWAAQDAEIAEFLAGARERLTTALIEAAQIRSGSRPYLWETI